MKRHLLLLAALALPTHTITHKSDLSRGLMT
jgi:hypothetical protein